MAENPSVSGVSGRYATALFELARDEKSVDAVKADLERFDARLAALLPRIGPGDLLVITADHGNDPTTPSTDHSREHVTLLVYGPSVQAGVDLGTRQTFADLGQTLAELFGVGPLEHGTSFLNQIIL